MSTFPILSNHSRSPAPPHARLAEAHALEQRLRATVQGEVRFDSTSRALYATDASNYRQVPIGVVFPRDAADVLAAVSACRDFRAPVLSRGGGTSLAGQSCNVAVILDFSRHMHRIHSLDPRLRLARVEPGIVLDVLRDAAEQHKLTFAPDPATHNRCTLGGMIGNNSCGPHALMGGKTVDNIRSLEVLLYDGTRLNVGATPEDELTAIIAAGGRRGTLYEGLRALRDRYAPLIRERFPRIPRRVSGYNLDDLLPEYGFHVARALVGSEGTCVTVLEANCELVESPQHRSLVVLGFPDAFAAADNVPAILTHRPIAIEGFDGVLVDNMRAKRLALDDLELLPAGRGFLLVEFGADSPGEAADQARRLASAAAGLKPAPEARVLSSADAARVWKVREAALGACVFVPGDVHRWEGWEDSAVPPERLGQYLRELFALFDRYGYNTPIYGHFGQGCIHLRINFDLETAAGIAKYRAFLDEAADLVIRHGGSLSGEHGDGQSKAVLLPRMYGPELMKAFREFKALFDPLGLMNPGKVVDPVHLYEPTENLRLGAGFHTVPTPETYFAYPDDKGSLAEATLRCVGVGACRKGNSGTMCPSYMATREEQHSTRGRAHLLWELLQSPELSSDLLPGKWGNEGVKSALDLCLSCKACKTECPAQVDMATWKAEFFAQHYRDLVHPAAHYGFGYMDQWARLASVVPASLANLPGSLGPSASLLKRALRIAPQRTLPRFAARSFRRAFHSAKHTARPTRSKGEVLLWPDTWNNYFHPEALQAAAKLVIAAGFTPIVPKGHICCGRPLYDFGFLDSARDYLHTILDRFAPEIDRGLPVIVLEPSCASVFWDELLNFLPTDARAQRLARQTVLLDDFLLRHRASLPLPDLSGREIVVHGHCHQKALRTMKPAMELLRETGARPALLDSGCCGMAGPFGFEQSTYAVSQTLANRVLIPAVRAASPEAIILTDGFSCREQIHQNTARRALHLAQVLGGDA